jgi:hypothetical protein
MQYDLPNPPRSRKRSSAWIADDDNNPEESLSTNLEDLPSKRLLNNRGEAIPTKPLIKYNAQKLLNHLAFTRIYVTANFQNFNPNGSFIVLCMVSEQNDLYQALWYVSLRTALTICNSVADLLQPDTTLTLQRCAQSASARSHRRVCEPELDSSSKSTPRAPARDHCWHGGHDCGGV